MDELKSALEAIRASNPNGMLRPSDVVDAARNPASPLHTHFEWNDGDAAEKWREEQARQLIRGVTITLSKKEPVKVRAYVSLPADRESGAGYRSMRDVMDSEFLRRQLANDIQTQASMWVKRAEIFGIALDVTAVTAIADQLAAA